MGRRRVGHVVNIERIVDEFSQQCRKGGRAPLVKHLAIQLRLTPVTLSRRYFEATGEHLSSVLRDRHDKHLREMATRAKCLETLAEATGFSCARSVRRRLRAIQLSAQS